MEGLKSTCIVLYASPYRIVDEKTGEVNEGTVVQYLLTPNLLPYVGDRGLRGYKLAKASIKPNESHKIQDVPGLYDLGFALKTNANGKPELKLETLEFLHVLQEPAPREKS